MRKGQLTHEIVCNNSCYDNFSMGIHSDARPIRILPTLQLSGSFAKCNNSRANTGFPRTREMTTPLFMWGRGRLLSGKFFRYILSNGRTCCEPPVVLCTSLAYNKNITSLKVAKKWVMSSIFISSWHEVIRTDKIGQALVMFFFYIIYLSNKSKTTNHSTTHFS